MLALIGSGEFLPPIEPVDRFLLEQLTSTPRVICLPTAAGSESPERVQYWIDLGIQYFSRLGVAVEALPIIDRASANSSQFVEIIQAANFVYLSGGRPGYLLKTLRNSLAWEAILQIVDNGGLLAGCSAGAMIMGESLPGFPLWQKAFNLVPGVTVIPHYDEVPERFLKVIRLLAGQRRTLIGIDGNTALFINQAGCQVVGLGGITVWNQDGHERLTHGQAIRLE